MRRLFLLASTVSIALMTAAPVSAQSNLETQKIRAYYFAAQDALEANRFDDAIDALDKAKGLRGATDARALSLRVKSLIGKGDYITAKSNLETLYSYDLSEDVQREMAPILLEIEAKAEEAERLKQEEADEKLRREQEAAEAEAQLARERAAALVRRSEAEVEAKRQAEIDRIEAEKRAVSAAREFAALDVARQVWKNDRIDTTKAARVSSIKRGATADIPPPTRIDFKGDVTLKSSGRLPNGDIVLVGERKRREGGMRAWIAVFDANGNKRYVERFKGSEFSTFQNVHVDSAGTILVVGAASDNQKRREKMKTLYTVWTGGKNNFTYTVGDSGVVTAVSPGKDGHYVAVIDTLGSRLETCKLPKTGTDKRMEDSCTGVDTDGIFEGFAFNDMIFDDRTQTRYAVGSRQMDLGSREPETIISNAKTYGRRNMEGYGDLVAIDNVKVLADMDNLMTVGHVEFSDELVTDQKFNRRIKWDGLLEGAELFVRNFDENGESANRYRDVVQPSFTVEDVPGVPKRVPNVTKSFATRIFGSPDDDYARAAVRNPDGGLIIAADRVDGSGVQRGWIVGLDRNHDRIWDIHLPSFVSGERKDGITGLYSNGDGSYTVAGSSGFDGERTDVWLQTFTPPR